MQAASTWAAGKHCAQSKNPRESRACRIIDATFQLVTRDRLRDQEWGRRVIVHPDFLDHRKTAKLIERSGDAGAPMWLLRLWAYCQVQRRWVFEHLDAAELKHVCRASIDADQLLTLLVECRWITMDGQRLTVRDWEQHNRMLVSAWDNGKRGGAPTRSVNQSGQSVTRSVNRSTRARVGEEDKIRAGYPTGSDAKHPLKDNPLESGPLAGGIKAGKLLLVANSETDEADARRRAALEQFGGLSKKVAQALQPRDNSD